MGIGQHCTKETSQRWRDVSDTASDFDRTKNRNADLTFPWVANYHNYLLLSSQLSQIEVLWQNFVSHDLSLKT